jgi:hypothetical protein
MMGVPGCRNQPTNRWGFTSVLNGPTYNMDRSITLAAVFKFALDSECQESQLNPPPMPTSLQPSSGPCAI